MWDELLRTVLRFALGADGDSVDLSPARAAMIEADEARLSTLADALQRNTAKDAAGALDQVDMDPQDDDRPSVLRALAVKLAAVSWPTERVASFLAFSLLLTGFDRLDARVARAHLGRASVSEGGCNGALAALLARWDAAIALGPVNDLNLIIGDARALVESLIFLWYSSTWPQSPQPPKVRVLLSDRVDLPDDPSVTMQALMWPAISAHPPMLSGGYFGYWRYPPES